MLLVNISWRFQKNGLLQSRGFEAAGKYLGCQMAGCYWGLPLPHRVGHGGRRHRDPGRGLPGGQQALDPIGVRPRHNDHLGLAHAGRYWQVDMNCRSKMGSNWNHCHLNDAFYILLVPIFCLLPGFALLARDHIVITSGSRYIPLSVIYASVYITDNCSSNIWDPYCNVAHKTLTRVLLKWVLWMEPTLGGLLARSSGELFSFYHICSILTSVCSTLTSLCFPSMYPICFPSTPP